MKITPSDCLHQVTDADSSTNTKISWSYIYFFFARQFYTLYEQKFANLKLLLSITFPQGFRKTKKFGHLTSENGRKKTFKLSEQLEFSCKKNFFAQRQFYTLYEQKLLNLRALLSISFPQGFRKSKKVWGPKDQ